MFYILRGPNIATLGVSKGVPKEDVSHPPAAGAGNLEKGTIHRYQIWIEKTARGIERSIETSLPADTGH